VLVGHSYGGMNMQLFARRYPYLVAGMVLVDSSSPEQIGRLQLPHLDSVDDIRPSSLGGISTTDFIAKPVLPESLVDDDGTQFLAVLMMSRVYTMRTVANEYLNFKASARQVMRNKGRLPDVPLVVLSRGRGGNIATDPQWNYGNEDSWQSLQAQLAHTAKHAAHIIATRSGHAIHAEQPELVFDAVTMTLDFARANARAASDEAGEMQRGTTWLPFSDAIWVEDRLHTAGDVCPFGCKDDYFDSRVERSGHLAGTETPAWQRVPYRKGASDEGQAGLSESR
jgi:pimeloyl-ACP methyl ester carboxylesterase